MTQSHCSMHTDTHWHTHTVSKNVSIIYFSLIKTSCTRTNYFHLSMLNIFLKWLLPQDIFSPNNDWYCHINQPLANRKFQLIGKSNSSSNCVIIQEDIWPVPHANCKKNFLLIWSNLSLSKAPVHQTAVPGITATHHSKKTHDGLLFFLTLKSFS